MKHINTNQKLLHSIPNIDRAMYDGKTVEFIFDQGRALLLLTGRFVFQSRPNCDCVDIRYTGRLDPFDTPLASYIFQLSQAHLESTVPATKPGAKVDFLMERPLWRRDCLNYAFGETIGETLAARRCFLLLKNARTASAMLRPILKPPAHYLKFSSLGAVSRE